MKQKIKKTGIWMFLSVIILFGCKKKEDVNSYTVTFEKGIKRDPCVEVTINEIIRPDFISKIGERILVLSSISDTMIHEYDLKMSYIRGWGNKGASPDEITNFPMFCKGGEANDTLYLWGFSPVNIRKFSENEVGFFRKDKDIRLPYYDSFNFMSISKDSIFYYYDVNNLLIKKVLLNSKKEESISFEKDTKDDRSSAFFSNRGVMDTNTKHIVYAYMYKNQIDIYDKENLTLIKRYLTDNDGLDVGQYDLTRHYTNVVASNKYIYAYRVDNSHNHLLEIYDFDGNSIIKNVLKIPIPLFVIDESSKSIIGFNFEDEDHAFIYNVPELN